jgi:DNA-directed RNA polymerase subunit K/omega
MTDTSRPTTRPANSFEFVTIAAARARQLLEGCVPRVDGSPKPARRALQEVVAGAVKRAEQTADGGDEPGVPVGE